MPGIRLLFKLCQAPLLGREILPVSTQKPTFNIRLRDDVSELLRSDRVSEIPREGAQAIAALPICRAQYWLLKTKTKTNIILLPKNFYS